MEALHFEVNGAYQPQVLEKLMEGPGEEERAAVLLLPQTSRLTHPISKQHARTVDGHCFPPTPKSSTSLPLWPILIRNIQEPTPWEVYFSLCRLTHNKAAT